MTTPDFDRYERMVAWANEELDPYIASLIPGYTTANLALTSYYAANVLYGRDVRGVNANGEHEPFKDPDLDAFGSLCAEVKAHFSSDYLWSPPRSSNTLAANYKVLAISHHFRANQHSKIWG